MQALPAVVASSWDGKGRADEIPRFDCEWRDLFLSDAHHCQHRSLIYAAQVSRGAPLIYAVPKAPVGQDLKAHSVTELKSFLRFEDPGDAKLMSISPSTD